MPADFHEQFHTPLAPTLAALLDDPRRGLSRLAEAGFHAVQLSATQPGLRPRDLDQAARRDLAATLRRRELIIAGIDLWIPPAHFIETAHVDRAMHAAMETIALAGVLGRCPVCLALPGKQDEKGRLGNDDADNIITALLDTAHRHGVPIADHVVPPDADRADDELLGIGIDPAAWLASGHDPIRAVQRHGNRLHSARLVDLAGNGMRSPIGGPDGRLDLAGYAVALSVASFQRPLVLDARQWPDPWTGIVDSVRAWRGRSTP